MGDLCPDPKRCAAKENATMCAYRKLIIETFWNPGEPSSAGLRARPVKDQGFTVELRVECSRSMRNAYPPGTMFELMAQPIDRKGTPLLYVAPNAAYEVVSPTQAVKRIAARHPK